MGGPVTHPAARAGSAVTDEPTCSFKKNSGSEKQPAKMLRERFPRQRVPGAGIPPWGGGVRFSLAYVNSATRLPLLLRGQSLAVFPTPSAPQPRLPGALRPFSRVLL